MNSKNFFYSEIKPPLKGLKKPLMVAPFCVLGNMCDAFYDYLTP